MPKPKKIHLLKKSMTKKSKKTIKKLDEISNDVYENDEIEEEKNTTPKKHNDFAALNDTPVKKSKNNRRKKKNLNESFNITNLNILFNSDLIYNSDTASNVFINKNSSRKRSHSSVPKFDSPVQEEPYKKYQYIQTPKKTDGYNEEHLKTFPGPLKNKLINTARKNDVNINPYLKNLNRDGSCSDASFFSPKLFQQCSSTPINAITSPKTPKGSCIKMLINSNRKSLKSSPLHSQLYCSKNASLQFFFDDTETLCCENFFMRLKKYCRLTQQWTARLISTCFQLGMQIKHNLSSLYAAQNNSLQMNEQNCCKRCCDYQEEITKLSLKVIEIDNINKENINHFNIELQRIKNELAQFVNVKTELESLKEEFLLLKNHSLTSAIPPPPPLPPSIPVPPPPPPLPVFDSNKPMIFKKTTTKKEDKDARPVISLDDILKVKLKKPDSSKLYHQTPISSRSNSSHPAVSLDMLKKVKLRPPTRRNSIQENEPLDVALSPNSKLCRLLKSEMSSGTRLKRLRRFGGLSCDSVYRRKFTEGREREFQFSES